MDLQKLLNDINFCILTQCKDFTNKDSANQLAPLLIKASELLAPKHFRLALDGFPLPRPCTPDSKSNLESRASEAVEAEIETLDEELYPDLVDLLMEKGKMLEQHTVVSHHARNHLVEVGDQDAFKR